MGIDGGGQAVVLVFVGSCVGGGHTHTGSVCNKPTLCYTLNIASSACVTLCATQGQPLNACVCICSHVKHCDAVIQSAMVSDAEERQGHSGTCGELHGW